MKPKLLCLILLVCLAAVFVKSETSIEVGDDGDEYEVKRFNIEGRQVNGGRSQCVVTRRKRASAVVINRNDDISTPSGPPPSELSTLTTKPSGIDTSTKPDSSEVDEGEENGGGFIHYPAVVHHHGVAIGIENVEGQTEDVHAGSESAVVADPNRVVVVETDKPPKVNPDTHAVFEVLPVEPNNNAVRKSDVDYEYETGAGDEGDDEYDGDNDDLIFEEEINPVTTTGIWSTGDDTPLLSDLYGDYNNEDFNPDKKTDGEESEAGASEVSEAAPAKPVSKPKPKPRPSRRPKPRPKPKPGKGGKRPSKRKGGKNKRKRGGNRKPSNRNKSKKKKKKNKKQKKHPNRLPANKRKSSKRRGTGSKGNKRRRPFSGSSSGRKQNSRRRNGNRKRLNKVDKHDKGTQTFTKTLTETHTGTGEDGNKDVNCIIIHKDSPSTTPRPFWNILGRNAEGGVGRSGAFGHRKRANLRFNA